MNPSRYVLTIRRAEELDGEPVVATADPDVIASVRAVIARALGDETAGAARAQVGRPAERSP